MYQLAWNLTPKRRRSPNSRQPRSDGVRKPVLSTLISAVPITPLSTTPPASPQTPAPSTTAVTPAACEISCEPASAANWRSYCMVRANVMRPAPCRTVIGSDSTITAVTAPVWPNPRAIAATGRQRASARVS